MPQSSSENYNKLKELTLYIRLNKGVLCTDGIMDSALV